MDLSCCIDLTEFNFSKKRKKTLRANTVDS